MSGNKFAMVSEWMTNGNLKEFIAAHQDENRFELVSSPFGLPESSAIGDHYSLP